MLLTGKLIVVFDGKHLYIRGLLGVIVLTAGNSMSTSLFNRVDILITTTTTITSWRSK
jgi:hypothetical protein